MNKEQELHAALMIARAYVEQAVKDDGGIDNCEIGDRLALERIDAALAASPASGVRVATHRHVKRGSEYVLIGYGKVQAENWFAHVAGATFQEGIRQARVDMAEVAVYRSVDDGTLWVRPREEFEDGRFEALSALGEHP